MTKEPQNVIGSIVRILNEYEVLAKFTTNVSIDQVIGVFSETEPIYDPVDNSYIDDLTLVKTRLVVQDIEHNYAILETFPERVYFMGRKPLNVDPKDIKPIEYDTVIREGDLLIMV
jgi:hypothetical protein